MKLKIMATTLSILILSNILILGFPLLSAEDEELNEEIIILPNSTRELTIEVKKGTDIDFSWNITDETQIVVFNIKGKGEGLTENVRGTGAEGLEEDLEGEKYTFIWENLDTKEKVTLNYNIIYESKPEEETGCYTTAILISILIIFIIFSAFGLSSRKY
jgi:hypothetical protein